MKDIILSSPGGCKVNTKVLKRGEGKCQSQRRCDNGSRDPRAVEPMRRGVRDIARLIHMRLPTSRTVRVNLGCCKSIIVIISYSSSRNLM